MLISADLLNFANSSCCSWFWNYLLCSQYCKIRLFPIISNTVISAEEQTRQTLENLSMSLWGKYFHHLLKKRGGQNSFYSDPQMRNAIDSQLSGSFQAWNWEIFFTSHHQFGTPSQSRTSKCIFQAKNLSSVLDLQ